MEGPCGGMGEKKEENEKRKGQLAIAPSVLVLVSVGAGVRATKL